MEIICPAGALMKFWAGLYTEIDRKTLEGVNTMLNATMEILTTKRSKVTIEAEGLNDNQDGGQFME